MNGRKVKECCKWKREVGTEKDEVWRIVLRILIKWKPWSRL